MSFGNGLQTYCVLKLSMKFLYVLKSIVQKKKTNYLLCYKNVSLLFHNLNNFTIIVRIVNDEVEFQQEKYFFHLEKIPFISLKITLNN